MKKRTDRAEAAFPYGLSCSIRIERRLDHPVHTRGGHALLCGWRNRLWRSALASLGSLCDTDLRDRRDRGAGVPPGGNRHG